MSSLFSALQTANSALTTEQAAINVTGNNIANVGNANYSREVAVTSPSFDVQSQPGQFIGTGVDLTTVQRQVDDALNSRLRSSGSDNSSAQTTATWIGQVQSTLGALSGNDLSSQMSTFFTGWSNLANNPTDSGQRQVVLQDGANIATYIQGLNSQLNQLQTNVNTELPQQVTTANNLATDIAKLNVQIVQSQGGTGGTNNSLQDQRDDDLSQLSQLVNISTAVQTNGSVNVYIGSQPLIEGQTNHGLSVANVANGSSGTTTPTVVFTNTGGTVDATSGVLGALEGIRSQITDTTTQINTIATNLITSVNQIHASGQGTEGFSSVTSTNPVNDPTKPLNSPGVTGAGLTETPVNGSFVVHVTQANNTSTSTLVPVNLGTTGTPATLNSLAASLNAINGVSATITGGKLTIKSTSASEKISFSQDSSNVLSSLGINTFFSGNNASDIAVNSTVSNNPALLAASQNGEPGDNSGALAISQVESKSLTGLNGDSLQSSYQNLVNTIGNAAATAKTNATAAQSVQTTLQAQQQSLSGVSINEETVNLMKQQQAFQAAARVVSVVSSMYTSLLSAFGGA
jgi:flagellar hook-associated protein 1 FlgK